MYICEVLRARKHEIRLIFTTTSRLFQSLAWYNLANFGISYPCIVSTLCQEIVSNFMTQLQYER